VGKSLLASNLAVALASDTLARVALIDLNLQYGDIAVMLHMEHHTMAIEDLTQQGDQLESEFLEQVMADGPAETRVLLAPSSPEYADLVSTATVRAIVRELSRSYDYIVVDAAAYLEERVLETIELADVIILLTTFNITSVKNTKITLNLFNQLGVHTDRVALVLNQTRPKVTFTREEIEEILRMRVMAQLPYDPRVDEAVDSGKPFIEMEPRSDLSKQIHAIVQYLQSSQEPDETAEAEPRQRAARNNRRRFSLGRH
jgi:pilus assembly protein CpaE